MTAATIRIEITSQPQRLADVEAWCRVARRQGFGDEAWVDLSSARHLTVKTDSTGAFGGADQ